MIISLSKDIVKIFMKNRISRFYLKLLTVSRQTEKNARKNISSTAEILDAMLTYISNERNVPRRSESRI